MMKWSLRACRAQAGYSQREVADFVGVTPKSVNDWENGYSTPSLEHAQKVSTLYEIPIEHMDFTKAGNPKMDKDFNRMRMARKLEPDTVTLPV